MRNPKLAHILVSLKSKRLKPRLDIVEIPENRVHRLTLTYSNRTRKYRHCAFTAVAQNFIEVSATWKLLILFFKIVRSGE